MFLTMPETAFHGPRPQIIPIISQDTDNLNEPKCQTSSEHIEGDLSTTLELEQQSFIMAKRSYLSELLYIAVDRNVSLRKIVLRPIILMIYPTVFWSSITYGMSLSWNVILECLVAQLFSVE